MTRRTIFRALGPMLALATLHDGTRAEAQPQPGGYVNPVAPKRSLSVAARAAEPAGTPESDAPTPGAVTSIAPYGDDAAPRPAAKSAGLRLFGRSSGGSAYGTRGMSGSAPAQPARGGRGYTPETAPPEPEPSTLAPETYSEQIIAPGEAHRAGGALTVPAESAPPGTVSAAGRKINFPRDPGDDVDVLRLQVFLDYHGFSPGEIDGKMGYNTERALYVYQTQNGMNADGMMDEKMRARVAGFKEGFLIEHSVTEKEATGPYVKIPRDYHEMPKLKRLGYESAIEALGERFHCAPLLLRKLNPGVDFDNLRAGQAMLGLNVDRGLDDQRGKVTVVRISKHNKWIEAFDAEGRMMFYYPSTLGSQYDPLPLGNWTVTGVQKDPPFSYQPKLFWDADPNEKEELLPPGPNSPVGPVWIGTSRKSVGIHGTPNPENISKNTSHGCIRMCNWDALQLSSRVASGTKLEFVN